MNTLMNTDAPKRSSGQRHCACPPETEDLNILRDFFWWAVRHAMSEKNPLPRPHQEAQYLVQQLLPWVSAQEVGLGLQEAVEHNDLSMARLLLHHPHTTPTQIRPCLHMAVVRKLPEMCRVLLGADTHPTDHSALFILAIAQGEEEIARLLQPHANIQSDHSKALAVAARHEHHALVDWLFPLSDPHDALGHLGPPWTEDPTARRGYEILISRIQQQQLQKSVSNLLNTISEHPERKM